MYKVYGHLRGLQQKSKFAFLCALMLTATSFFAEPVFATNVLNTTIVEVRTAR